MKIGKYLLIIPVFFLLVANVAAMGKEDNAAILSKLTGKTTEEINTLAASKTYKEIAEENSVADQFFKEKMNQKLAMIDLRLKEGRITEEEAKEMKARVEDRIKTGCTGEKMNLRLGRNH